MTEHRCQLARTRARTHTPHGLVKLYAFARGRRYMVPGALPWSHPSPPPRAAKINPAVFPAALHAPSDPRSLEPRTRASATNQKRAQLFRQQMHQQLQLPGSRAPTHPPPTLPPHAHSHAQCHSTIRPRAGKRHKLQCGTDPLF